MLLPLLPEALLFPLLKVLLLAILQAPLSSLTHLAYDFSLLCGVPRQAQHP